VKIRHAKKQLGALHALLVRDLAEATADAVAARLTAHQQEVFAAEGLAQIGVVKALIAVLDVAEDALRSVPQSKPRLRRKEATPSAEVKALAVVHRNLLAILQGLGIERIDPVGEPIDYVAHDLVMILPTDMPEQDGLVSETLRPGYRTNEGMTIRAAMVAAWKYESQPPQTQQKKGA
jgi:molecular chaperone GrpE